MLTRRKFLKYLTCAAVSAAVPLDFLMRTKPLIQLSVDESIPRGYLYIVSNDPIQEIKISVIDDPYSWDESLSVTHRPYT